MIIIVLGSNFLVSLGAAINISMPRHVLKKGGDAKVKGKKVSDRFEEKFLFFADVKIVIEFYLRKTHASQPASIAECVRDLL